MNTRFPHSPDGFNLEDFMHTAKLVEFRVQTIEQVGDFAGRQLTTDLCISDNIGKVNSAHPAKVDVSDGDCFCMYLLERFWLDRSSLLQRLRDVLREKLV